MKYGRMDRRGPKQRKNRNSPYRDHIVITGRADTPCYMWIKDGRVVDSMGICNWPYILSIYQTLDTAARFFNPVAGMDWSGEQLQQVGERIRNLERMFDVRQGVSRDMDALPKKFFEKPLSRGKFDEQLEQKYALKASGYNFDCLAQRVAQVMGMRLDEVTAYGKSPLTIKTGALLCFWAHRKLGMTTVGIPDGLGICQSAVSRLSKRGEKIARELRAELIEAKA